ncbi:hypothetical protein [Rhodopirellula bahusiensis]|uniref:hypothetical protein n=1 Tax=Rhodopirellula bahusiensis TaxID=2014065 RepID=UPI003264B2EF
MKPISEFWIFLYAAEESVQRLRLHLRVWLRQRCPNALSDHCGHGVVFEADLDAIGQASHPTDGTIGDPSEGDEHQEKECHCK